MRIPTDKIKLLRIINNFEVTISESLINAIEENSFLLSSVENTEQMIETFVARVDNRKYKKIYEEEYEDIIKQLSDCKSKTIVLHSIIGLNKNIQYVLATDEKLCSVLYVIIVNTSENIVYHYPGAIAVLLENM